ncbi:muconate/chloromuconate family cycloisomerase [Alkalibacillus silvisoli]|uniref:Muconate/chloromuconate family cycloisomerase n=1 Tax=Alkalibacillus silvisoli TaxID=392823 RepID=A0ABN0ZJK2_9BACI
MSGFNIKKVSTRIVDLPIKRPHQFSTTTVSTKAFVIVEVTLNNGVVGYGEGTTPGIWWNGESVESMDLVINQYLSPIVLNQDARSIEKILTLMDRHVRANSFAKAAVEMALYDALGKAYGVPVYQLLGGLSHESIPVCWALATGSVEGDVKEAKEYVEAGRYQHFKVKAGKLATTIDVKRNIELSSGLDGVAQIGIDPNGSWDRVNTVQAMDLLKEANIAFLEQPLAPHDFEGMARLSSMNSVPVMADESVQSIQDAYNLAKQFACNLFSLKIHKFGGLKNTVKVAAIAEAAGIDCFGGTSLESSIGTAASLHAFATVRNLSYGCESFGPDWLKYDLVKEPLPINNGQISVPQGPGLGVEVSEEMVEKFSRKAVKEV